MDERIRKIIERIDALRARGEQMEREQHHWLEELSEISSELDELRQRAADDE